MVPSSWTQKTLETGKVRVAAVAPEMLLCLSKITSCFPRAVFVQLACAFRYGSDDLDVMGLCFRKDIWIKHIQIYPESHKPALSSMHDMLLKKAGDSSYPFTFEVRRSQKPSSVAPPLPP